MSRIYADHAATTAARPEVVEAMLPYLGEFGFNPSSLHAEGRRARAALDAARDTVARLLGARAKEIVFTAGGTEADNLAIFGTARSGARAGRRIVSAATEHHAVVHALDALADEGWEIVEVPLEPDGTLHPAQFAACLGQDAGLATVMLANNETGVIQPVAELARIAHERGVLFHTDAVQAPAHLALNVGDLAVDMLSLSAHKFYGPKGTGALYVREGTPLTPLVHGGSQEFAKRAGTENVAGIVGMATALELACAERDAVAPRLAGLRDRFEAALKERLEDIKIVGEGAPRLPAISNIAFAGVASDALVLRLDLEGVAVSAGSACAAGSLEPSHVMEALGLDARWRTATVRFSFGRETTADEIARLTEVVVRVVTDLRSFSVPGML